MSLGTFGPFMSGSIEWVVGTVFLAAAVTKWTRPEATQLSLTELRVPFRRWRLHFLVCAELVLGGALVLGVGLAVMIPSAIATLVVFTAALWRLRAKGLGQCGCFGGVGERLIRLAPELRNMLLILALILDLLIPDGDIQTPGVRRMIAGAAGGAAGMAFAIANLKSIEAEMQRRWS